MIDLILRDLLADELEARQGLLRLDAVLAGDLFAQVAGDDGIEHDRVLRHGLLLRALAQDVLQQHRSGLVAGHHDVLVALLDADAHAVGIRVADQDDVRLFAGAVFQRQLIGARLFRVGSRRVGEVRIRRALLKHRNHMVAGALQQRADRNVGGAVLRREDDLEMVLVDIRIQLDGQDVPVVFLIDILADDGDQLFLLGRVVGADGKLVGDRVDLGDDGVRQSRNQLAAFLIVELVAVVLLRVVAGGDHDAAAALLKARRERQFRRRPQAFKHVAADAVAGQHGGGVKGELEGIMAVVVADGHAGLLGLCAQAVDIHRKAFRGLADRVNVDAVGAGAHDAAHAGRAEFNVRIERVADFLFIHALHFAAQIRVQIRIVKPTLVVLLCVHDFLP